jgi:hypothetical protein
LLLPNRLTCKSWKLVVHHTITSFSSMIIDTYAEHRYADCRNFMFNVECHYSESLTCVMLSVIMLNRTYADCRNYMYNIECHHADCRNYVCYAQCHYAKCYYTECHYSECCLCWRLLTLTVVVRLFCRVSYAVALKLTVTISSTMLSVTYGVCHLCYYAEYHYAECPYTECGLFWLLPMLTVACSGCRLCWLLQLRLLCCESQWWVLLS